MKRFWEVIAVYRDATGRCERITCLAGSDAGWKPLSRNDAILLAAKMDWYAAREVRVREEGETSIGEKP